MIAIDCSNIKNDFEKYCDVAVHDFETIIVTRGQNENVVVMSESEYNNIMENLYIRENKTDYARLLVSIEQLRRGDGQTKRLVDDE
ncbi:MAG: type II toxin-antitoxin system prevent-host-death family antitoxin [Synergistaceae bacterium]|jgi:antitoxin YefM|nr:type II toxin-antitoxin system prevent-host-death family antitoxin [Synergistaceae bacterium]